MMEFKALVLRVVDGDTYDLVVDLGFHVSINVRIRLKGIDTPEIYHASCPAEKEHGMQAKAFAEELVLNRWVTLRSWKGRRGKYGRWLGDLITENGESLTAMLRHAGFVKREDYHVG